MGDALSGSPEVGSGNCLLFLVDSTIRAFPAHHPSPDLTSMERLGPVGLGVGYESFSEDLYSAVSQDVGGPRG